MDSCYAHVLHMTKTIALNSAICLARTLAMLTKPPSCRLDVDVECGCILLILDLQRAAQYEATCRPREIASRLNRVPERAG